MIFQTAVQEQEKPAYIRFFNAATGISAADIFVNSQLVVEGLAPGVFSPYRKAKPGAYAIEVRLMQGNSDTAYSELVSLMPDTAYTMVLSGDAAHLTMVIIPLDMRRDVTRPNVRFANLIPYDTVIDIEINKQTAVWGLMYKEVSDHIEIAADNLNFAVKVLDSKDHTLLEDWMEITPGGSYLAIISGSIENPQNLPQMHVADDAPML